jgi:hypothetical protein
MRTATNSVVLALLAALACSCSTAQRQRAGAGVAFVGLGVTAGGVVAATDHCTPEGSFCRAIEEAHPEVGLPLVGLGVAMALSGVIMLTVPNEARDSTSSVQGHSHSLGRLESFGTSAQ